ncbi:glucokinase [Zobellella denitrificans]|uniref:Glucokinase n=1 Tax=Zobellella denitrificans TaxID=347534 RepID=A0A291HPZ4_9GAMM|nr:glucokinase [Zobellella denitrificans]ATG74202.1 glucokinase [Zobellella denitrificans]
MSQYILVGDVGGTNARLALCKRATGVLSAIRSYPTADSPGLEPVIRQYLAEQGVTVAEACIAIACPVQGDQVVMTNHSWRFSIAAMQAGLGLARLEVINDFTAVSMAIPALAPEDRCQIGGGEIRPGHPVAVYGAGTGLGVAHLVPCGDTWLSLPGEGGHVDLAPGNAEEEALLRVLRRRWAHVSAERLLSGQGLVNLYQALAELAGRAPEALAPGQITERALGGDCALCQRTLALFCELMGRFGGNLALNLGTFGGVYLAGGIVPRFLDFFRDSGFRAAFEDKGRFSGYLAAIPVFLITHPHPGLLGAGAYLRQQLGFRLDATAS